MLSKLNLFNVADMICCIKRSRQYNYMGRWLVWREVITGAIKKLLRGKREGRPSWKVMVSRSWACLLQPILDSLITPWALEQPADAPKSVLKRRINSFTEEELGLKTTMAH